MMFKNAWNIFVTSNCVYHNVALMFKKNVCGCCNVYSFSMLAAETVESLSICLHVRT